MKHHEIITKIIIIILALAAIPNITANAENTTPTYSIITEEDILANDKGDTIAVISYDKLVIDGKNQAIKKINQSIENDCKKNFTKYKEGLFINAETDYYNGTLYDKYICIYDCKVTYNEKDIISLKITWSWYAGGVRNKSSYGVTYSLKTGNKLKLTDVIEGSSSKIKNTIISATEKYLNNLTGDGWSSEQIHMALDNIKSYKITNYKYYLKGNKVHICYDEYELIGNYYGGNIISISTKDFSEISKAKATLTKGTTLNLKVYGVTDIIRWKSSDESIAKVSSKGKVTAIKVGTATITAKVDGKSYSCKITVK